MAHLVTFQNPKLDHPENGEDIDRVFTGYSSRTEELIYEIIYTIQTA